MKKRIVIFVLIAALALCCVGCRKRYSGNLDTLHLVNKHLFGVPLEDAPRLRGFTYTESGSLMRTVRILKNDGTAEVFLDGDRIRSFEYAFSFLEFEDASAFLDAMVEDGALKYKRPPDDQPDGAVSPDTEAVQSYLWHEEDYTLAVSYMFSPGERPHKIYLRYWPV